MKIINQYTSELPVEERKENYPRQVINACSSIVAPKKPSAPKLIHKNKEVLQLLGLEHLADEELTNFVTGKHLLKGATPYAMCYGGHQFGQWAGQLGDGRAINIAEIEHQHQRFIVQLKGAGQTPYSRGADGLAVLRSSIREYLCSEAMHHLGVPTTRAMTLATTGDTVIRDILYNGNPQPEKGAIVARVAPSFIRFGNFELFTARQDFKTLKKLTDYTIRHHFKQLGKPTNQTYLNFFEAVCQQTKTMLIHWQRVGFVHGVMNTDNMSILGLTIDYGPYGWLDNYDPNWTPNTTDVQEKRYRFGNQFQITLWNLTQLANALYPLIKEVEPLKQILRKFRLDFWIDYQSMLLEKLGITDTQETDETLTNNLLSLLERSEMDMTLFYRNLNQFNSKNPNEHITYIINDSYKSPKELETIIPQWEQWLLAYQNRTKHISNSLRVETINAVNPKYVLRNYMAQLAIEDAEKEDYNLLEELFELLKKPYDEQPKMQKWFKKRPDWAKEKIGCSMLSCSS